MKQVLIITRITSTNIKRNYFDIRHYDIDLRELTSTTSMLSVYNVIKHIKVMDNLAAV